MLQTPYYIPFWKKKLKMPRNTKYVIFPITALEISQVTGTQYFNIKRTLISLQASNQHD